MQHNRKDPSQVNRCSTNASTCSDEVHPSHGPVNLVSFVVTKIVITLAILEPSNGTREQLSDERQVYTRRQADDQA